MQARDARTSNNRISIIDEIRNLDLYLSSQGTEQKAVVPESLSPPRDISQSVADELGGAQDRSYYKVRNFSFPRLRRKTIRSATTSSSRASANEAVGGHRESYNSSGSSRGGAHLVGDSSLEIVASYSSGTSLGTGVPESTSFVIDKDGLPVRDFVPKGSTSSTSPENSKAGRSRSSDTRPSPGKPDAGPGTGSMRTMSTSSGRATQQSPESCSLSFLGAGSRQPISLERGKSLPYITEAAVGEDDPFTAVKIAPALSPPIYAKSLKGHGRPILPDLHTVPSIRGNVNGSGNMPSKSPKRPSSKPSTRSLVAHPTTASPAVLPNLGDGSLVSPSDLQLAINCTQMQTIGISPGGGSSPSRVIPKGFHMTSLGRIVKDNELPLTSPALTRSVHSANSPAKSSPNDAFGPETLSRLTSSVARSYLPPSPSTHSLPAGSNPSIRSKASAWSINSIRKDGRRLKTSPPTPYMPFYRTRLAQSNLPRNVDEEGWDEAVKYCKQQLKDMEAREKMERKAKMKAGKGTKKCRQIEDESELKRNQELLKRLEERGSLSSWRLVKPASELSTQELIDVSREMRSVDSRLLRTRANLFAFVSSKERRSEAAIATSPRRETRLHKKAFNTTTVAGLGIDYSTAGRTSAAVHSWGPSAPSDAHDGGECATVLRDEMPDEASSGQSSNSGATMFRRRIDRMGKNFSLELDRFAPLLQLANDPDARHPSSRDGLQFGTIDSNDDLSDYSIDIDGTTSATRFITSSLSPPPLSLRKETWLASPQTRSSPPLSTNQACSDDQLGSADTRIARDKIFREELAKRLPQLAKDQGKRSDWYFRDAHPALQKDTASTTRAGTCFPTATAHSSAVVHESFSGHVEPDPGPWVHRERAARAPESRQHHIKQRDMLVTPTTPLRGHLRSTGAPIIGPSGATELPIAPSAVKKVLSGGVKHKQSLGQMLDETARLYKDWQASPEALQRKFALPTNVAASSSERSSYANRFSHTEGRGMPFDISENISASVTMSAKETGSRINTSRVDSNYTIMTTPKVETSAPVRMLRRDLGLGAIRNVSHSPYERHHPKHDYEWHTRKIMCKPSHVEGALVRTCARTQCSMNCCKFADLVANSCLPANHDGATDSLSEIEQDFNIRMAEKLRVLYLDGIEGFDTFLQCDLCKEIYCPQCVKQCDTCSLIRCKVCKEGGMQCAHAA